MKLTLVRNTFTDQSTIGDLSVDGKFFCHTLEDQRRPDGEKVHGSTCIPPGVYRVTVTASARFKRALPLLLNVPNFAGIRIHPGNAPKDTEGCILVGRTKSADFIGESRVVFEPLFALIDSALSRGEKVEIEITEER
jgi:hypothetical protein